MISSQALERQNHSQRVRLKRQEMIAWQRATQRTRAKKDPSVRQLDSQFGDVLADAAPHTLAYQSRSWLSSRALPTMLCGAPIPSSAWREWQQFGRETFQCKGIGGNPNTRFQSRSNAASCGACNLKLAAPPVSPAVPFNAPASVNPVMGIDRPIRPPASTVPGRSCARSDNIGG